MSFSNSEAHVTEPSLERDHTVSTSRHYYDLTVVYCLILIVLTFVPWPEDSFRRVGIDVVGVALLFQAGISFMRARRARARELRDLQ
jgi:hypothetical protein